MADINQVASAFTQYYYQTFDRSRQELMALYVSFELDESFSFLYNQKN
jgi:hypothetical protein